MSAAAIIGLAPYVLEALGLATQYVNVLTKDHVSEEDMEALKARFEASQANRDQALDSLKDAIDAARQGQ